MEYNRFDQIDLPNLLVTEAAPAHDLDFRRYSSDQVAAFNKVQYDILKAARPDLPVIHNFMGRYHRVRPLRRGRDARRRQLGQPTRSATSRSATSPTRSSAQYLRQGDPDNAALPPRPLSRRRPRPLVDHGAAARSGELGRSYNPDPLPGMARLWAWEAFAHGAEVVTYFRWRQAPFAQEQMHAGLLRPDSEPAPAYHEAKQVAEELKAVGIDGRRHQGPRRHRLRLPERVGLGNPAAGQGLLPRRACARALCRLPQARHRHRYPAAHAPTSFAGYDIVAIPALFAWNDALAHRHRRFRGPPADRPALRLQDREFRHPRQAGARPAAATCSTLKVTRVDSTDPTLEVAVKGGGARAATGASASRPRPRWSSRTTKVGRCWSRRASSTTSPPAATKALMQRVVDYLIDGSRHADADPAGRRPLPYRAMASASMSTTAPAAATLTPADDETGYVLGDAAHARRRRHGGATRHGRLRLGIAARISNVRRRVPAQPVHPATSPDRPHRSPGLAGRRGARAGA